MPRLKLTLVVCSYNQAAYLRRTLESLIHQRNLAPGELEILVMDGGSTDGSVRIIEELAPHFAYWVTERDHGQTDALIKGFAKSVGDIQGWLCSDDVLEPDTVREVLDFFAAHPESRFVYGDAYLIDERDRIVRRKREIPFNWFIWKYDYNYIPQPSAFWRRDLYRQVGGLDPSFDVAMDGDLFARFAVHSQPRHVARFWSRFRLQPDQKTQRRHNEHIAAHRRTCAAIGSGNDNRMWRGAAFFLAKGWRVSWKLVNGCYFHGEAL